MVLRFQYLTILYCYVSIHNMGRRVGFFSEDGLYVFVYTVDYRK